MNAKIGSQEIPGIIGKFGIGVQNEVGQKLTVYCQENMLVITNNLRHNSMYGYHYMVNPKLD